MNIHTIRILLLKTVRYLNMISAVKHGPKGILRYLTNMFLYHQVFAKLFRKVMK